MKPNSALLKLIIKLLILIILFILIFIISTVLYSARYWPDIYNYVNANITIKRIPTLSEITVAEIEYTTELTTEFDYVDSTTDAYEYFEVNDAYSKEKREVNIDFAGDYSEVPEKGVLVEYVFIDEPTTVNVGKVPDLIDDSEIGARDFKDVYLLDGHHRIVEEFESYVSNLHLYRIVAVSQGFPNYFGLKTAFPKSSGASDSIAQIKPISSFISICPKYHYQFKNFWG